MFVSVRVAYMCVLYVNVCVMFMRVAFKFNWYAINI